MRNILINLAILAVNIIVSVIVTSYINSRNKRLGEKWTCVAEGTINKIIPHDKEHTIRIMGLGRLTIPPKSITTLFFEDGGSIAVKDVKIPPLGSHVKIYKNPLPEFKIETA